jgi:hypothetical protein
MPEGGAYSSGILGAVQTFLGRMTRDQYMDQLAERVQKMVEEAEWENVQNAERWLYQDGLLDISLHKESAGDLIIHNMKVQDILSMMGVPGKIPVEVKESDKEAERIFKDTDLLMWVDVLTRVLEAPR